MADDDMKYCSVFDLLQNNNVDLGILITKLCMSGVVMRKCFIMPPNAEIKKLQEMSAEEAKSRLKELVLSRPPYTLAGIKDKKGDIVRTIAGSTYTVTVEGDSVMLNGVEIEEIASIGEGDNARALFKAKKELTPTTAEPSAGGARKKKKKSTKSKKKSTKSKKKSTKPKKKSTKSKKKSTKPKKKSTKSKKKKRSTKSSKGGAKKSKRKSIPKSSKKSRKQGKRVRSLIQTLTAGKKRRRKTGKKKGDGSNTLVKLRTLIH